MKAKSLFAAIFAAMCLTGCFSLEVAPLNESGVEHIAACNYGWTLFNWIPLVSGNASENPFCDVAFFRDDATVDKVMGRFQGKVAGRPLETPVVNVYDTVIVTVFGIPIPYVICYKEVSISGTVR